MQETRVENNTAPKPGEGRGGRKGKSDVPDTLGKNPHQTLPGLTRRLLGSQPHAYPRACICPTVSPPAHDNVHGTHGHVERGGKMYIPVPVGSSNLNAVLI